MYKRVANSNTSIQRLSDGAFIPFDERNTDYRDYLDWVNQDNTPQDADPIPVPVPASITRRQCAIQLREMSMITAQEALNMTKYGDVPMMVSQAFNEFTEEQRLIAETDFAADQYLRDNPLLNTLMTAIGHTQEEIDQFFRDAANR